MKKQKSELLEAETLLSLCLSNLHSYETLLKSHLLMSF